MSSAATFYIVAGLFSFAGMGIVHKFGELLTMVFSATLAATQTCFTGGSLFRTPATVALVAVPFGISCSLALWVFQAGLRHGHISTSWLLINLSSGVPALLSLLVYHDRLTPRQVAATGLAVVALFLLWWDRRQTEPTRS